MELPQAKERQKYIDLVTELEQELKRAVIGNEVSEVALRSTQEQLDSLAKKYQHDEKIGTARYKLYELQAFIYYFAHTEDKAWDFINQAIELRGSSYPKAEKLKANLSALPKQPTAVLDEPNMTKEEKRKNLIGIEGWLALFVVGSFLSLGITIFNFFYNGFLSSSDIDSLNQYQSGLGDTFQVLTAFENLAIIVYVALIITSIVLILRKRKSAKAVTIATLTFGVVYGVTDYAIASSLFMTSGLDQYVQAEMSSYAGTVGRSILGALTWIPYFLASKRVKATFTK